MRSVMISINPKWCELIANGKKTIEVRKTKPRCDVPFRCYIYCTNDRKIMLERSNYDKSIYLNGNIYYPHKVDCSLNGKVIGEFICYRIDAICPDNFVVREDAERALEGSCISVVKFKEYMKYAGTPLYMRKDAYAWHISDLVIYDKPKELDTFYRYCGDTPKCHDCDYGYYERTEEGSYYQCVSSYECYKPITRPPQSWCYAEIEEWQAKK